MENKKNKYLFLRVLFALFIIFLCLYSISMNGYIERKYRDKTIYTEEQIKEFEKDILSGNDIDLKKYNNTPNENYENAYSKMGEKISNVIEYTATKTISALEWFFTVLFE